MRAFVAIVPPLEVIDKLEQFLEPRRLALAARKQWRWTRPEHLHLTLAFLPEFPDWREEELIATVTPLLRRQPHVQLRIAGAGAFPDPSSARVLWTGATTEPSDLLGTWAHDLRAAASHAGARVSGTQFRAHFTLARSIGRPHPAGPLVQALDTLRLPSWAVTEVRLMASHLGQGPNRTPRYEVRHTWETSSGEPEG